MRAPAVVVEIATRGWAVTSGPSNMVSSTTAMLKTTLRVEPPGEPTFDVTKRLRYPQLSIPSAGTRLDVIFDRDDHDTLMIDDSARPDVGLDALLIGSAGGDDRLGRLEQLGRLREQGVVTDAEFAAEKRRILDGP